MQRLVFIRPSNGLFECTCASINKQGELLRILWLLGKRAFLLLAVYHISLIHGSEKHGVI